MIDSMHDRSRLPLQTRRQLLAGLGAACLPALAPAQPRGLAAASTTTRIDYEALLGGAKVADVVLNWTRSDSEYQISLRFDPVIGGDRRYESRGLLTASGLRPLSFRVFDERSSAPRRVVDFDHARNELRHGTETTTRLPLASGTQDVLSLPFHLARLRPSAELEVAVSHGGAPHLYRVSARGAGRISGPGGPQAVERYQAVEGKDRMDIALQAGEPRLPVQTGLVTRYGTVTLLALRIA